MTIEFDPAKDALNFAKHGVSLSRAGDMDVQARVSDPRFDEVRLRAYGLIDGRRYRLAYVVRNDRVRAISLRRAHRKEYGRHVT